jgi:predicted RNA-binding protein with EMAP domain
MNQEYFEKISDMMKKAQEPMQSIAELNVKTLQSYSYIKPEEFSKTTKPDELLEKQLEIAISNGHKALDYMQKSFQILEKAMLCFAQETKTKADGKSKA